MKSYRWIVLSLLCLLVAGIAWARPAQERTLPRQVMGSGGTLLVQGHRSLNVTLGQPVVGRAGAGQVALCAGFWCRSAAEPQQPTTTYVYLPLLLQPPD